MSDRDWRSERDARADRYGSDAPNNSNNPNDSTPDDNIKSSGSGGGGGRYNRALQRRSERNNDDDSARRDTSHERVNNTGGGDAFYPDGSNNSDSFYRQHQRPRFDTGYNNAWQQQPQHVMPGGYNEGGNVFGTHPSMNYNNNFPLYDMMAPQQQLYNNQSNNGGMMPYGMPGFDTNTNHNGMNPAELLQFLLQQQQHRSNSSEHVSPLPNSYSTSNNSSNDNGDPNAVYVPNSAPAASRVLPSVDEFVPVVPKSLLNLVRGGPTSASPHLEGGEGITNNNSGTGSPLPPGAASSSAASNGGALVLLEAPKIAPEVERRAREQRRAHISGFPNGTTKEELEHYFRLLLPEVRRLQTEREMHELAEETGLLNKDGDSGEDAERHIPANANLSNIDELRDLTLNQGKTKAFSFIELRLADMVNELVQQCQADPQRFLFTSSLDGRSYPLAIRCPRDAEPLTGVEASKVVVIGFPLTISVNVIKSLFESFGELLYFELKNGYAYGEFAELRDATEFRADVHGQVLGNSMVVALPLYDWLKVLLVREGLDIPISDDDPVSGSYVMKQVRERITDSGSRNNYTAGGSGGGNASGVGGGAGSTALVIAEDPEVASLQIMREMLDMSFTLPDMLARFAALHPHLRPLYANTQVTVYPTPVLVLLNLFDEEELVHDSTYSILLADIEEEVERYGRVRQLIVPRREARPKLPEAPRPGVDYNEEDTFAKEAALAAYTEAKKNFGAVLGRYMNRQTHPVWGGYGRVFVEYETVDEAAEAQQQIAGKLFGERTVVTSFLFPDLLKEEGDEPEGKEGKEEKDNNDKDMTPQEDPGDAEENVDASAEPPAEAKEEDDDVAESATSEHAEDID